MNLDGNHASRRKQLLPTLSLFLIFAAFSSISDFARAGDPTGACCSPTGACLVTTQEICEDGGRDYQGDGTTCDPNPCEALTGACCFPDFTCLILEIDECAAAWGIFAGDGIPCDPTPCVEPIGACCLVGNLCAMSNFDNCFFGDGEYQGHGTSCATMPCDPTSSNEDGRSPAEDLAMTGLHFSYPVPNPTAGPVRFSLELVEPSAVRFLTLDVNGRAIAEDALRLESGRHIWTWHPKDGDGRELATGMYYVRVIARTTQLDADERSATRTVLVSK